jgi:hypothetical protein
MKISQKQATFLQSIHPKEGCLLAGRGFGKTTTLGLRERTLFNALPRAKFFLAGNTFAHLLRVVLPEYRKALEKTGMVEYTKQQPFGHFVVCKKPPNHFLKPLNPPEDYSRTITFINGYSRDLLSFDRGDLNRGGNFDGGDVDELALFAEDDYNYILSPMIRANPGMFTHPLHYTFRGYTSIPKLSSGQWVFKFEEKHKLNQKKTLWLEGNALDNALNLRPGLIEHLRETLPKRIFDTEIMNQRFTRLPNSYYPAFSEATHTVTHTFDYDYDDETGLYDIKRKDHDPRRRLKVTFDFNIKFTCYVVSQVIGNERRFVAEGFEKDSDGETIHIKAIKRFCTQFKDQKLKEVILSGDVGGNRRDFKDRNTSLFDDIEDVLKKEGWIVDRRVIRSYPQHKDKFVFFDQVFKEASPKTKRIRINAGACPFLVKCLLEAPILDDFQKDKSSEKSSMAQEYATHLSDAFDYDCWEDSGHTYIDAAALDFFVL